MDAVTTEDAGRAPTLLVGVSLFGEIAGGDAAAGEGDDSFVESAAASVVAMMTSTEDVSGRVPVPVLGASTCPLPGVVEAAGDVSAALDSAESTSDEARGDVEEDEGDEEPARDLAATRTTPAAPALITVALPSGWARK